MNGQQQMERHTAISRLDKKIDAVVEAFDAEMRDAAEKFTIDIGLERTHRLKLADEQRAYVDSADRELRRSLIASDDYLGSRIRAFETLTLWGRIRWAFTGRTEARRAE